MQFTIYYVYVCVSVFLNEANPSTKAVFIIILLKTAIMAFYLKYVYIDGILVEAKFIKLRTSTVYVF